MRGILNSQKKMWLLISTVVVTIVALAAGIGIYNTPANRLQRQLDLGNRYLEELNYEQAIIAFEQVITIDDRCMEAYVKGLQAYLGAGDMSRAEEFYGRTLTMLAGLDKDFLAENMDAAVELYLAAGEIYAGESERIAEILEEGLTVTGEDSRIRDKLIETYLGMAKEKVEGAAYEGALAIYDRLLELDSTNAAVIDDLCDCLNQYINQLMEVEDYDKIRELAKKYGDVATKVDFEGILARITELERIETENRAFMKKIYDLMAAEDYDAIRSYYGDAEAEAFFARIEEAHYIYFPGDGKDGTGTGAGVYKYENQIGTRFYVYYGGYLSGERSGEGSCADIVDYKSTFVGNWDHDAPNGKGIRSSEYSDLDGITYEGELVDGLWNGEVSVIKNVLYDDGQSWIHEYSFFAEYGIPEDITEEVLAQHDLSRVNLEEGFTHLKDNEYLYVYDVEKRGNSESFVSSKVVKGKTVGVLSFAIDS